MQSSVSERIKTARKELKLNQEQFGAPIGLSQSAIAGIERGVSNITEQTKILLNHIHNISIRYIENGEEPIFEKHNFVEEPGVAYGKDSLKEEIEFWKRKFFEINDKYTALLEQAASNKDHEQRRTD